MEQLQTCIQQFLEQHLDEYCDPNLVDEMYHVGFPDFEKLSIDLIERIRPLWPVKDEYK